MREANDGTELVPIHAVVPEHEGSALLHSLVTRLSSLDGKMTQSESAINQICNFQHRQMAAFEDVMQNMEWITDTLAGLNIATLRNEVVGVERDMIT